MSLFHVVFEVVAISVIALIMLFFMIVVIDTAMNFLERRRELAAQQDCAEPEQGARTSVGQGFENVSR